MPITIKAMIPKPILFQPSNIYPLCEFLSKYINNVNIFVKKLTFLGV